ncbi:response regulator [Stenotrophomonas sp.]|uniref:response regulator transcription factor n=1 Tax=Stenotrophomonas sp. TaxID=69392 RepID=UPI0028A5DC7C|nr:response regulator [Stenotrophomonas sp.]
MNALVHVVDDDPDVLTALGRCLKADGLDVSLSASPEQFLTRYDPTLAGCVVLDLNMPGMDGLAVQRLLAAFGEPPSLIFVSATADVPSCASAMRAGALDFLTKPVDAAVLLAAVRHGIDVDADARVRRSGEHLAAQCYSALTPRERQVLPHIIGGRLNKQIAADLGISLKTAKVHRSRIMQKFGVRSVAALVRQAERAHVACAAF